jgi:hypothetical protein
MTSSSKQQPQDLTGFKHSDFSKVKKMRVLSAEEVKKLRMSTGSALIVSPVPRTEPTPEK